MHNSSKFRGPSPNGDQSTSLCQVSDKEFKKIKVTIHRKITNPEPDKKVDRSLENPEKLNILRHKGEGKKPIFDRTDVIVNKDNEQQEVERGKTRSKSPRTSRDYYNHNRESPRRDSLRRDTPPRRSRSPRRISRSPRRRESPRRSPRRDRSRNRSISPRRQSSSRYSSTGRRSRSRERIHRSRHRSRTRSRTPRRRIDHRYDRRRDSRERRLHSRERRYRRSRSRSPRRGRYGPPDLLDPLDPLVPLVMPQFYGPAEYWLPGLRPPPIMVRGMLPPRGMFRPPMMGGLRPHMPRPPFIPLGQARPPLPNIVRPRPPRE